MPKIWKDNTAFILGGGPTLATVDFDLIKDRRIIAVNNAYGDPVLNAKGKTVGYLPRSWVDVCFFGDARWYGWHKRDLFGFPGLIITCRQELYREDGQVRATMRGRSEGLDPRPDRLAWNRSSGGAAIDLAFHFGVKRIVLLGYDMRRVDDRANWHEDHPAPHKNPYDRFLDPFPAIARDAAEFGLEIINATPNSAIKLFRFMTLEEILADEKVRLAPEAN